MIPIGDDNPTRTVPYITYGIIALNVFVYLVDVLGHFGLIHADLGQFSMIPYSVVHNLRVEPAIEAGRIVGFYKTPGVGLNPQLLTIFTSMFMHGGLLHIVGNMLYLWIFGNNIEDALGHFRFLIFYFACGTAAALLHLVFNMGSPVPMVGASGAIAGVLGAYLLLYPTARVRVLLFLFVFVTVVAIPASVVLVIWFLGQFLNVLGGQLQGGGVAYWAHIGGFATGMAIIIALGGKRRLLRPRSSVYDYYRD